MPELSSAIDNLSITDEAKSYLKDNIASIKYSESFRKTTEYILNEIGIDVKDLWPIFGKKSLYEIRNILAHGRRTKLSSTYNIAREHLQFLLERLVLNMLGFNYNLSTAGLTQHGIRIKYTKQQIEDFQSKLEV